MEGWTAVGWQDGDMSAPRPRLSLALGCKWEARSGAEFNQHLFTGVGLSEELFHSLSESLCVTQQQLLRRPKRPWSHGLIQDDILFCFAGLPRPANVAAAAAGVK